MKRALAVFLAIGMIMSLWAGTALAERAVTASGQCGAAAYWTLYADGELIISGSGATYDFPHRVSPWHDYIVKSVTTGENITGIGSGLFGNCSFLVNVDMPNVVSIGDSAFHVCIQLISVVMPKVATIGSAPFYRCTSLTSITVSQDNPNYRSEDGVLFDKIKTTLIQYPIGNIRTAYSAPDSVTKIGKHAFSFSAALVSVELPNVTIIDESAFYLCSGLESIGLPNTASIGNQAFFDCDSLVSVELPNAVSIGDRAFSGSHSLSNITVSEDNPNYLTENGVLFDKDKTTLIQYPIGNSRTAYSAPDSVTSIGVSAFYSCNSLTSVVLPSAVAIGSGAFDSCGNLISTDMPNAINIDYLAFYCCDDLASVELPNAISIGFGAFSNCDSLVSVELPSAVSIDNKAFSGCDILTRVVLPNAVTIDTGAFDSCGNLASAELPNAVSIGDYAFYGCNNLTSLRFHGNAPSFGLEAIPDSSVLTVYYPINKTGWETPMAVYGNVRWTQWNPLPHIETVTITNISENGRQIYIEPQNVETGSKIITAFYKNNCLVNSQFHTYEGEPLTLVTYDDIDKIKIMIWDAARHLKPLAIARSIDL